MSGSLAGLPLLRPLFAAVLLCFGLAFAVPAGAQTPLVPPGGGSAPAAQPGSLWQQTLGRVHQVQRDLHRRLAAAVRAVNDAGSGVATLSLMAISLLYGVFHAVGPGHGKAVISAYLLANERAVRRGIQLAFLASLVQGISAILLVGVLAVLLDVAGVKVRESAAILESASYALVALVGAWMLLSLLRGGGRHHHHGHDHGHHHHHHHHHHHDAACGHNPAPDPALRAGGGGVFSKAAGLVLAVGIRPCSGAVLVLLFALAQGVLLAGIAATFAMSFGTAVTVSLLAVLTLYSKRLALALVGAGARTGWVEAAYRGLAFLGAGLLLLIGAGLFWGSLAPAGPL
ncbi:nickel/cobalt transporter [Pelagibius sp. 7325]|uniref:nickel/cobalt transporter n=1 Tax=Pelagibius sp. 7325 TaxID=3131994 RepID=UPI0030EC2370